MLALGRFSAGFRWGGVAVAAGMALALAGVPVRADEAAVARLRELETQLREVRTVQTDFVQEKRLAVFSRTVTLTGRIALERGERLSWQVATPVRHAMVIQGDRAQLWDEDTDRVQTIDLGANPAFKAMFEQMRAWFSGEYSALAAGYEISVRAEDPLTFAFVPRAGTAMAAMLAEVTVTIAADRRRLSEIAMVEVGGDSNRLRFLNTVLDAPIPEDAWRVPPP